MPTYAIVKESTVMELTAEEKELVMKNREKAAREAQGAKLFKELKAKMKELEDLGFEIELPSIGGKYVSYHHPVACSTNITLSKKWRAW